MPNVAEDEDEEGQVLRKLKPKIAPKRNTGSIPAAEKNKAQCLKLLLRKMMKDKS